MAVTFRVSCRLKYAVSLPATLFLGVRVRPSASQKILSERLRISPSGEAEAIVTIPERNRLDRIMILKGPALAAAYEAEVETRCELLDPDRLRSVPPARLDERLVPFVFPSRYCQSDKLGRLAWQKFGRISPGYDQVLEITNWIHRTTEYLPGTTTSATSAYDTVTQRAGVCRDFAHLGIALCRALSIPARYFSGYAYQLDPPDFHACFEAYIGGHWILFDPTGMAPANGLVHVGSGRDAADASVCTAFGMVSFVSSRTRCELVSGEFEPLSAEALKRVAVSLDAEGA
jgi:transglutaminase-like putative cysteine protease